MGVSLEQYRAAIGSFNGGSHQSMDNSLYDNSDISDISDSSLGSSSQRETILIQKASQTGGSWKLHAIALMLLSLSLISTCIALPCQKLLLVRAGVETNPGPICAEKRQDNQKKSLAELCVNAPDMEPGTKAFKKTAIRDCIRLYQVSSETASRDASNKTKLNANDRDILLATLEYLGGRNMDDYTKPAVITALIARIDHHLPHSCSMCESDHTIIQGTESLLNCSKCGRGVHDVCFLKHIKHPAADDNTLFPTQEEIMKAINPLDIPGWSYLCNCCNAKLLPSPDDGKYKRKAVVALKPNESDTTDTPVIDVTDDDDDEDLDDHQPDLITFRHDDSPPVIYHYSPGPTTKPKPAPPPAVKTQPKQNTEMPTCRFYMRNKCKHGMSGKGIPGTECKFSHPRRCPKLAAFGTGVNGCKKGNQCKFFHPQMCNNSLKTRSCPNLDCEFVHIKGTKRSALSHTKQPQNEYVDQNDQNEHTMHNSNHHTGNNNNDRDHFLEMLRELRQELFQMVDQRFTQHPLNHQRYSQPPMNPMTQHHPTQMMMKPLPVAHQSPQMMHIQNQTLY